MAFIETRGIVRRFPGVVALNGVSLAIELGQVHVLAGENGAGKSTLVKILTGTYRPSDFVGPDLFHRHGRLVSYAFTEWWRPLTPGYLYRFVAQTFNVLLGQSDELELYLAFVLAGHHNLVQYWLEKRPDIEPRVVAATLNRLYYAPFFLNEKMISSMPRAPRFD